MNFKGISNNFVIFCDPKSLKNHETSRKRVWEITDRKRESRAYRFGPIWVPTWVFGDLLEACWSSSWAIWEPCGSHLGFMWVDLWAKLKSSEANCEQRGPNETHRDPKNDTKSDTKSHNCYWHEQRSRLSGSAKSSKKRGSGPGAGPDPILGTNWEPFWTHLGSLWGTQF